MNDLRTVRIAAAQATLALKRLGGADPPGEDA